MNVLNGNFGGCDALGADSRSATADFNRVSGWVTDNEDKLTIPSVGNPLYASLSTSTEQVFLNARYQVPTKCSAACRGFRFGSTLPGLTAGVLSTYSSILTLAWLGGLGAFVCLVYLIFVVLQGPKATQNMYLYLYVLTLSLCFVLWVMLCVYLSRLGDVQAGRAAFMANADCITDETWASVVTSVGAATDLGSVWAWMIVFMIFFLLCTLVGVCVLCHVMKKLAQCGTWRAQHGGVY